MQEPRRSYAHKRFNAFIPPLLLGTVTLGSIVVSAISNNDSVPAACTKEADDRKMAPGEGRHKFMVTCLDGVAR